MESIDGAGGNPLRAACEKLVTEIREFIDLSLEADEHRWEDWVSSLVKPPLVSCWLEKGCRKAACPAYEVENARCWLVAGTMCGCEPTGDFAIKYRSCTKCDVYQEAVYGDPVVEIYEHILTLVHNLKSRQDRLLTMATRDLLTGLFNRNHFNDVIGREVERARRYGESLSFMVIDLDRFKQINDEYGHLHGDGVLRTFAGILESSVRRSDMLSRFGGGRVRGRLAQERLCSQPLADRARAEPARGMERGVRKQGLQALVQHRLRRDRLRDVGQ